MKVLIAPTAFKGSFSPAEVGRAIEDGVGRACAWAADVQTVLLPLADGGDGTIEAVHLAAGGIVHHEQVLGATSAPTNGCWLDLGKQALVELASACGISPLTTAGLPLAAPAAHTWGLGQMILRCYELGKRQINIAVGGSASTDGGMGALRALGVVFFDKHGQELEALGGSSLALIRDCDLEGVRRLVKQTELKVLVDVDNPLLGPRGAARVFAPQKGASASQVAQLEDGLALYADVLETRCGVAWRDRPGAGAAGGTAFGLACALKAEIVSGFDWIAQITDLERKLSACDLIITGEGCFDEQSLSGKMTGRLLDLCNQHGKPLWVVAGTCKVQSLGEQHLAIAVPSEAGAHCSLSDIADAVSVHFRRCRQTFCEPS